MSPSLNMSKGPQSARSWLLRLLELRLTNFPTYLLTYLLSTYLICDATAGDVARVRGVRPGTVVGRTQAARTGGSVLSGRPEEAGLHENDRSHVSRIWTDYGTY